MWQPGKDRPSWPPQDPSPSSGPSQPSGVRSSSPTTQFMSSVAAQQSSRLRSVPQDPVRSLLASLDLEPSDLYAVTGPSAPLRLPNHPAALPLPFQPPQRETIISRMYALLLRSCVDINVLLPNSNGQDVPLEAREAISLIRRHGWSIAQAQRTVVEARKSARATAANDPQQHLHPNHKGKGTVPSHASSPTLSPSGSGRMTPTGTAPGNASAVAPGPEYGAERRGMPCGHVFAKGEAIWRCRDCALDDTCVQCAPCFMASVHSRENHDVVFSVCSSSGGCCDCGDEEAWVKDVGCSYHSALPQATASQSGPTQGPPDVHAEVLGALGAGMPASVAESLRLLMQPWIDFIMAVLDHAPEEQKLFPRSFGSQAGLVAHKQVVELQSLDEWADQLSGNPRPAYSPSAERYLPDPTQSSGSNPSAAHRMASPLPPGGFDVESFIEFPLAGSPTEKETPGTKWGSLPETDESPTPGKRSGRKYALLLWNDEKHSFREVIDTVKEALGVSEAEGRAVAERVDKRGRDVLAISPDVASLVSYARRMSGIDLEVTIRPAFDVFCEEVAHLLIAVIKDFAEATLYVQREGDSDAYIADASISKLFLCSQLLQPWPLSHRKPDSFRSPQMSEAWFSPQHLTKLDGFLLMDQKLWKEARVWVRGWYMSMIARKEGRRAVAFHYAQMYPKVIETFILREREPEHSVMLITVQLFSVPSIATDLVRHFNFLERLLQILTSIYTGLLTPATGTLELPPRLPTRASTQSTVLRQMFCRHIFYDARYLLQSDGVKELIVTDPRHLRYFVNFLTLFNEFLPEVRQTQHHVEFESEVWVAVFQVCQLLAKQAKLFGEAFEKGSPVCVAGALRFTARQAAQDFLATSMPETRAAELHKVLFGSASYEVINFRVDTQPTAFHHPLQWFFSELTKRLAKFDLSMLRSIGKETTSEIIHNVDETQLLMVVDLSLRTVVKISQVRCGMWVRNGQATRGQATHYRDVAMRATMYDQDVFLLQAGLALVPTVDRLLVTYLDRFGVTDFFSGSDPRPTEAGTIEHGYEKYFAEDFLLLLVTLLSEPSVCHAWPIEKVIRREIIHFLALNQGTYSALTRHIPDHMTDHPAFERELAQVSKFRAPDGTTDLGIFELKDDCYNEVNPFFHHYSRNQRERAEEQLRMREKKAGRSPDAFVSVPQQALLSQGAGVFAQDICRILTRPTFQRVLFYGLWSVTKASAEKDLPEAVLDASLQLVAIGIAEKGPVFIEQTLAAPVDGMDGDENGLPHVSILIMLCKLEDTLKIKTLTAKVSWCLDRAAELGPDSIPGRTLAAYRRAASNQRAGSSTGDKGPKSTLEAKRAAAKARQAAIMQKFSAQQKTLLESLENDDALEGAKDEDGVDHNGDTAMQDDEDVEEEVVLGSCIMCQEQLQPDSSFGCLGLIAPSRSIRVTPRADFDALKEVMDTPLSMDRVDPKSTSRTRSTTLYGEQEDRYNPKRNIGTTGGGFNRDDHKHGLFASTCGHLLHVRCFEMYYRNIEQRHSQQIARNHAEDLTRSEFVCPLCKSLGNVILPVPSARPRQAEPRQGEDPTFSDPASGLGYQKLTDTPIGDWLRKMNIDILRSSRDPFEPVVQETSNASGCFISWYADTAMPLLRDRSASVEAPSGIDEPTLSMLDRLTQVLRPLAASTRSQRQLWQTRSILAPTSRKMYIPDELVAYTLGMLEVAQRGIQPAVDGAPVSSVADGISKANIDLLRSLIFCMRSMVTIDQLNSVQRASRAGADKDKGDWITALRQGLLKRLLPQWSMDACVRLPLLLRDPLVIVVETAAIMPEYLGQVTILMYYLHLVQTIFGLAQPSIWPSTQSGASPLTRGLVHLPAGDISDADKAVLRQIFPDIRWIVGNIVGPCGHARGNISFGLDNLGDTALAKLLCTYTLPFLRRAAIMRRVVCGDSARPTTPAESEPVEYMRLLSSLGIPPPGEALSPRSGRPNPISNTVDGWLKHGCNALASLFRPLPLTSSLAHSGNSDSSDGDMSPIGASSSAISFGGDPMSAGLGGGSGGSGHALLSPHIHPILQLEHPHVYELISLPRDLTNLLQYSQRTPCRRCKEMPPDPALCLLCGELVCYQSFCCMDQEHEKGECNRHTLECGGNFGIFFKIKANVIFLLYHSNGSFTYSPYLDSHGEVDVGLQKGRPQKLHGQRYDELRRQWLSGSIGTIVARKIEASMDVGGWETT